MDRGEESGQAEGAADGIVFRREPPIAVLRLDRPGERNRLTRAGLERLGGIAERLRSDDSVHAVVVTGSGGEFSAGLLDPGIRARLAKEEVLAFVFLANRVFDAIEALPQIVIAAIDGPIAAGAVELALACDIRLAGANSTLTLPEAKWGGFPGAGAPLRLPMVVGEGRALELICTGREIDAAEMERIGLVEAVHPPGEVLSAALRMARTIGGNGPLATRGAKRILRLRREPGFAAARALSDSLRAALEWSQDVDEGIAAHRENRTPRFTGR